MADSAGREARYTNLRQLLFALIGCFNGSVDKARKIARNTANKHDMEERNAFTKTARQYTYIKVIYTMNTLCVQAAKGPHSNKSSLYPKHHIAQRLLGNTNDIHLQEDTTDHSTMSLCPTTSTHVISRSCSAKPTLLQDQNPRHSTHMELLPTHRHCAQPTIVITYIFWERVTACLQECIHNTPKKQQHIGAHTVQ